MLPLWAEELTLGEIADGISGRLVAIPRENSIARGLWTLQGSIPSKLDAVWILSNISCSKTEAKSMSGMAR